MNCVKLFFDNLGGNFTSGVGLGQIPSGERTSGRQGKLGSSLDISCSASVRIYVAFEILPMEKEYFH